MLCRKQHAKISLDASKIMILILKIKNADKDSCQATDGLAESLGVDHTIGSRHFKALGMIQKQGNWVLYELKPIDVEQLLFTCK